MNNVMFSVLLKRKTRTTLNGSVNAKDTDPLAIIDKNWGCTV